MTFPLVLGSGRRLFNDGILPATMRPVDLTVTDLGIILDTYEPAGPVRHRQIGCYRAQQSCRTRAVGRNGVTGRRVAGDR